MSTGNNEEQAANLQTGIWGFLICFIAFTVIFVPPLVYSNYRGGEYLTALFSFIFILIDAGIVLLIAAALLVPIAIDMVRGISAFMLSGPTRRLQSLIYADAELDRKRERLRRLMLIERQKLRDREKRLRDRSSRKIAALRKLGREMDNIIVDAGISFKDIKTPVMPKYIAAHHDN